MIDLGIVQNATLPIGAKPGQIILLVDLTLVPNPLEALEVLESKGYQPQLHFCIFATGLHVVAVLKNEQFEPTQEIDDDYLMEEWLTLGKSIGSDVVRLWRGHPAPKQAAGV